MIRFDSGVRFKDEPSNRAEVSQPCNIVGRPGRSSRVLFSSVLGTTFAVSTGLDQMVWDCLYPGFSSRL